jgi:hypothetical protein
MRDRRLPPDHRCTTGTGRHRRVPKDFCASRCSKGAFSHLETEYASLPTFSNPEFSSYTLLVFRPFILYNPSKMAEASA